MTFGGKPHEENQKLKPDVGRWKRASEMYITGTPIRESQVPGAGCQRKNAVLNFEF
jgi:hypothetical protein